VELSIIANYPTVGVVKEPIFKKGLENELVKHPLHIWFATSGCLRDASGTFLALL